MNNLYNLNRILKLNPLDRMRLAKQLLSIPIIPRTGVSTNHHTTINDIRKLALFVLDETNTPESLPIDYPWWTGVGLPIDTAMESKRLAINQCLIKIKKISRNRYHILDNDHFLNQLNLIPLIVNDNFDK